MAGSIWAEFRRQASILIGEGAVPCARRTNLSLADPGLIALVMMLRFQGLGINPEQIRHQIRRRHDRLARDAPLREVIWIEGPRLDDDVVPACQYTNAFTGHPAGWRLSAARESRRGQ